MKNKNLKIAINIAIETTLVFLLTGMIYLLFEVAWGTIKNPDGYKTFKNLIAMFIVGGLLGVIANRVTPFIKSLHPKVQYLITTVIILICEFWAGILINKILDWGNWDYSNYPLNFMGQICLPLAFVWYLLSPLLLWVSNLFRLKRRLEKQETGSKLWFNGLEDLIKMYKDLFLDWDFSRKEVDL